MEFDGEAAIPTARYDRRLTSAGRVHQEDLCQASGVYPRHKNESYGGPSAPDVVALLRRHGRPSGQRRNVERFTRSLIFSYLIGAPDAHAKNYSVLLLGDDVRLAPLYDVASGLPYLATQQGGLRSAAMAIAWEREFGRVERKHWTGFAAQTRQDAEQVIDALRSLAGSLPDAMSDALSDRLITRAAG